MLYFLFKGIESYLQTVHDNGSGGINIGIWKLEFVAKTHLVYIFLTMCT